MTCNIVRLYYMIEDYHHKKNNYKLHQGVAT